MYQIQKLLKRKWANLRYRKEAEIALDRPVVTFTFDDAPASAFETAGEVLGKFGYVGTYYIALSFLKKGGPLFTAQHVEEALAKGHEMACHTHGHLSLNRTPLNVSMDDIGENRALFTKMFSGEQLKNFSYPFGEQNTAIKKFVDGKFRSGRGNQHGINTSSTDLLNLKTVRLYEAQFPLDFMFRQLDKVSNCNGWLIFYTHDVKENFSKAGCSPAYFEAVVKEVFRRGLTVLTVDQALDFIGIANQPHA